VGGQPRSARSGSHNLVLGPNNASGSGGIVSGTNNVLTVTWLSRLVGEGMLLKPVALCRYCRWTGDKTSGRTQSSTARQRGDQKTQLLLAELLTSPWFVLPLWSAASNGVASVAIALLPAALPNEANTVTRLLAAVKQRRQWPRSSVFEATAKRPR
jgi:hypothetical protein